MTRNSFSFQNAMLGFILCKLDYFQIKVVDANYRTCNKVYDSDFEHFLSEKSVNGHSRAHLCLKCNFQFISRFFLIGLNIMLQNRQSSNGKFGQM